MSLSRMMRNLFNAEGIREAMRVSYKKHFDNADKHVSIESDRHRHGIGLYGALASRYQAKLAGKEEVVIQGEIAPFLCMERELGIAALAEYVVFQERPSEARVDWLKENLNEALCAAPQGDDDPRALALIGMVNNVPWCPLLEENTKEKILSLMDTEMSEGINN